MADPFLKEPKRKRRDVRDPSSSRAKRSRSTKAAPARALPDDEILLASDDDGDTPDAADVDDVPDDQLDSDEEFAGELATDKRRRLAQQYLDNLTGHDHDGTDFDAADLDRELIAQRLQTDVAEQKGYVYKFIGDKIAAQLGEVPAKTTRMGCRAPTGVAASGNAVYVVLKDGQLVKYTHKGNQGKLVRVKHTSVHQACAHDETLSYNTELTCVAALPKFVVTGTQDGHLIIWLSDLMTCLKVLRTRGAVLAITFRRGSDQLYAACLDLKIRTYSINQFQQLEILYGHQDQITDICALARETCVLVGARDKSANYWKIAEELRLTFRGGDNPKKLLVTEDYFEGLLDCVLMNDETHFVTGSDNGNVLLWSLSKKKPLFTARLAHGVEPQMTTLEATAERDAADTDIPRPQPYWITAVHAIPYSDVFFTGSYLGQVKVWKLDQELQLRKFELIGEVQVRGCVVLITLEELGDGKVAVMILTLKEHRLGSWLLDKIEGRNAVVTMVFDA